MSRSLRTSCFPGELPEFPAGANNSDKNVFSAVSLVHSGAEGGAKSVNDTDPSHLSSYSISSDKASCCPSAACPCNHGNTSLRPGLAVVTLIIVITATLCETFSTF